MGTAIDKLAGLSMVAFSAIVFIYYSFWVVVLPFFDEEHIIQSFFLPPFYAFAIPLCLVLIATSGLIGFVSYVMMGKNTQKKSN